MSNTESFEHAMEVMRENLAGMYANGHMTKWGDIDTSVDLDQIKDAHDHDMELADKNAYHRGYEDGRRSMDAEHYAVALRLMHLPLDGGSHENLSQIARAVYHADFGWTQGACSALRDELVRLMGGCVCDNASNSMPFTTTVTTSTYDVLGNERHKAMCELRKVRTELEESVWTWIEDVAIAIGAQDKQSDEYESMLPKITDRLIHLLGGDQPTLSEVTAELSQASVDAMSRRADQSHESSPMTPENETGITDELRKWMDKFGLDNRLEWWRLDYVHYEELASIADRIDERLKTIRQNDYDEWQLQTDKMRAMLTVQRDEARAKVLRLESMTGAYNDAVAERDELQERLDAIREALDG